MSEPTAQLDDAGRRAVVVGVARYLRDVYVEPDVGERAAAGIEQAFGSGAYDRYRLPTEFAERLTADLYEVAGDKHLVVKSLVDEARSGAVDRSTVRTFLGEEEPLNDSGVVRADRLPGGVGYIEIVSFPPPAFFRDALDRAMASLAEARAIIVDMRRNGGGDPHGVAYLVSFFLDKDQPIHVMDLVWRTPGTECSVEQTFTSGTPTSFAGKACCVLTSGRTFSGGEEFCYDMKTMELAVLVGETTAGGANPGLDRPLPSGLSIHVPHGKARSPVTGENWEGVGVIPDVAVAESKALGTALEQLGQTVDADSIDELSDARLFRVRDAPFADTEAALRRLIEEHARGEPDFDAMAPEFAAVARGAAASVRSLIAPLGTVEAVVFLRPWAGHGDLFGVMFAHGVQTWGIALSPDAKVAAAYCGPVQLKA